MAGPWEKYQSAPAGTPTSDGPWSKYQSPQAEQSPPQQGGDIVSAAEQRFGIPAGLLSAVINKESDGNSGAISPKGAIGLAQVMPNTARGMGYDPEELKRNPALQVEAGARYLKQMLDAHGNVADALAAYNWGPGNVQKFMRGEKTQIPTETVNYVTDPRFAQWTKAAAQPGSEGELAELSQQAAQPWAQAAPEPTLAENLGQASRGLAQSAVNVANIPGQVVNTALGAAGVPAEDQVMQLRLPESMRPTDPYAQLGAEIGPYLIPGLGAERTAAALASTAGAGRAERIATQGANMLAENLPGAIAQSTQNNDLSGNLAAGLAGSVIGRGLLAAGGRAAGAIRGAAQREGQATATAAEHAVPTEGTAQGAQTAPTATTIIPPEQGVQDVAARVGAAADRETAPRMADAARDVAPRQDVIDAAKQLGLSEDDLLLSHVSGNQAYRDFEQALKSVPGSQLAVQENQALTKIAKQATDLTDAAGALPDKAAMNDKFLSSFQRGIATVQNKSDQLYNQISSAIPKGQTVEANNIIRYLDGKADELGGAEHLSTMEKRVYNSVAPLGDDATAPTYARLDNIRKQIGQAIGKNSGPFRDEETGALKQLYANLTADQEQAVVAAGMGDKWQAAKKLIGVRTTMEDALTGLLGKDLRGDIGTKASLAIRNLAKGDAKGFRALQQDIPSPRIRREVVATSLRDAFSQGSQKENEFHLPGFVNWYQGLKSSGTLPIVERELGARTANNLRNLFTVSQAVRQARESSIQTGRLGPFIRQFDSKDGALDKIYRHGKGALATTVLGHIPVVGPTLSYGAVAGMAAKEAARPARSVAADRLLASPEFRSVVKQAKGTRLPEKGQQVINRKMEARIANSPAWKSFYRTLSKDEKQAIARVGIIGWLSGEADGRPY
ncbi:lytic murein transglycosylase [Serratia quinivorans]|uniref:lytic transglycosylase domain-containing protein n=1 Tax=Serratia quinivorans TaxID=137545 RepID=UPI0021792154|nr:lytic transglycosylase domain-containing protein [Serratia quinivorans]CAI0815929.1 lytic murein transglycosylase [Serratia quinivorans]CAI0921948.1 lytic murein transglycosylase [Serratia quinivorans]CAI1711107.1 lytic murein transglycosylase [Serratia quinivorans]CAI2088716.1 lytic murein transglycosylase [Serratia quinivorans]CAI2430335.1 lytic murein transglycosylase [Serratia quinivorans]